jgi:hypothetical protein
LIDVETQTEWIVVGRVIVIVSVMVTRSVTVSVLVFVSNLVISSVTVPVLVFSTVLV